MIDPVNTVGVRPIVDVSRHDMATSLMDWHTIECVYWEEIFFTRLPS